VIMASKLRIGAVFVTGTSRGLGLEFVKQLSELPAPPKHIFATCRNPDSAQVSCIAVGTR
jgi:NAD(P)-dependent dehydrogenase (short-subunit alcohol dehydrogenase family)